MKKLTVLIILAATIPAFTLSSGLSAQEQHSNGMQSGDRNDEPQGGETRFMSHLPAGALHVGDVIGTTVRHRGTGAGIGVVEGLIIHEDGHIIGALINTGNLMGLGGKEVAMSWDQLEHAMDGDDAVFYTSVDKATLWDAPTHERDAPAHDR